VTWTQRARRWAALALLAAGCDAPPPPGQAPPPEPNTAPPAAVADLPDGLTPESGMHILVKNPHIRRTADEGLYQTDPTVPSGRLVGACKWASPVVRRGGVPRPPLLKLEGPYAIPSPKPGEVEYYNNIGLRKRWYYVNNYQGTYPTGAVIAVRGIKRGRRPMFDRPTFLVRYGVFQPHMQFSPINERVMFGTYDSFPTHVRMEILGSGRVVLDALVAAFNRETIKPLRGGGRHFTARPKMLQCKVVTEIGPCEIRGTRHPWKRAYVVFVDNPYALVSNRRTFTFPDLPVGTWDVDVWHPQLRLVQTTYSITIRKNETTELAIRLHPPEDLKPKPRKRPPK